MHAHRLNEVTLGANSALRPRWQRVVMSLGFSMGQLLPASSCSHYSIVRKIGSTMKESSQVSIKICVELI